jgi:hypothetical protein
LTNIPGIVIMLGIMTMLEIKERSREAPAEEPAYSKAEQLRRLMGIYQIILSYSEEGNGGNE